MPERRPRKLSQAHLVQSRVGLGNCFLSTDFGDALSGVSEGAAVEDGFEGVARKCCASLLGRYSSVMWGRTCGNTCHLFKVDLVSYTVSYDLVSYTVGYVLGEKKLVEILDDP